MQHEALNQWHFVVAAYAVGLGGTLALLAQSWLAMRRAERRRDGARGK
jgi:nitrate reductase gamma subunit